MLGGIPVFVVIYDILRSGETPLHLASWHDDDKIVQVFVQSGADVNIVNIVSYYHACTIGILIPCSNGIAKIHYSCNGELCTCSSILLN